MKMHCPLARRITGFKQLNINPDLLAQNSAFRRDEPALNKVVRIDSGEGSFRCLRDIFLYSVFLKTAAFQKTLAGEEELFIARQDWDKNHIAAHNPNLGHCFNLSTNNNFSFYLPGSSIPTLGC